MEISWQKVLEIETCLNKPFETQTSLNRLMFPLKIHRSIKVDLNKKYSFIELLDYLHKKYPSLNLNTESLKTLFLRMFNEEKILEIDEELYDINLNQQKYLLSPKDIEKVLLDYWSQTTGAVPFFLHQLKTIIDAQKKNGNEVSIELIKNEFDDFYNKISKNEFLSHIDNDTVLNYQTLKKTIIDYTTFPHFKGFMTSCKDMNYEFPLNLNNEEDFINKTISHSYNEVLSIIQCQTNDLFGYKISKKLSPYPEDIRKCDYENLSIHISFYGLVNFDKITELKNKGNLLSKVQEYLSSIFNILKKEAIYDNYDPRGSNDSNVNCTMVIGKNTRTEKFYNLYLNEYHDKVMHGVVWTFNDNQGTFFNYLNYHNKSDTGKYNHSLSFENVLYKYLICYLECWGNYNLQPSNIIECGYVK